MPIIILFLMTLWSPIIFGENTSHFIDERDGTQYKYVVIGSQTWMGENLKFRADSGAICYDGNLVHCEVYGMLYSHDAALKSCPSGWHLPTDDEWDQLEIEVGMEPSEVEKPGWRGQPVGLLFKSHFGWVRDGNGFDKIGMNVLPAGVMDGGIRIFKVGHGTEFWTATYVPRNINKAINRQFQSVSSGIQRSSRQTFHHVSVRCVKDI